MTLEQSVLQLVNQAGAILETDIHKQIGGGESILSVSATLKAIDKLVRRGLITSDYNVDVKANVVSVVGRELQ